MRFFLDNLRLDVIGKRWLWLGISGLLLVVALAFLGVRGLNTGVDFTGGTIMQRTFEKPVTVTQVRDALGKEPLAALKLAGESQVQQAQGNTIIIRTRTLTNDEKLKVDEGLRQLVGPMKEELSATDTVGPVIGKELVQNAIIAVLISSLLILVYVTFRFEFKFGTAAILALLHDVFLTMGFVAVMGQQVNMPFVAAILTIVGYSINDTIVIFDRIRENLRFRKKESVGEIANKSLNETLARSINTVGTTLVSIIALHILGGPTLREFTLPLLFGILSGAYSSIFIAAPLWTIFKEREERKARLARAAR